MANKEDVLMALAQEWGERIIRDDELTRLQIQEALGDPLSDSFVRRKLKDMCNGKILQRRSVQRETGIGGSCYAYSPGEGKEWKDVLQYLKKNLSKR
jgi:predicted transcriptional regulator